LLDVEEYGGPEQRSFKIRRPEGRSELLVGKDGPIIVRVNSSVVLIPLFGVDVPSSSQSIRLSSELTRPVSDCQIKLTKELRPTGLARVRSFVVEKYSRFLWSVITSMGFPEPSK
jgi:hypothetical protein